MLTSYQHIAESNAAIADRLLATKKCDSFGYYWVHAEVDQFNPITKGSDETLDGGNARPLLHLLLAYKNTGDQYYLEVAELAAGRMVHYLSQFPVNHFGILSGNMGVALVLSYLSELSGNTRWINAAGRLAKPCTEEFLSSRHTSDGLANGRAGVLLALIFLYRNIREEWVIEAINKYLEKITARARVADNGIWWMDVYHHAAGLNGFFDGAAGIGLALKVAGYCLKNDMVQYLGSAAFTYVQSTYDAGSGAWKNLRMPVCTETDHMLHRSKFTEGDISFFSGAGFDDSIAHGAHGIAWCYQMANDAGYETAPFSDQADPSVAVMSEYTAGEELCALIAYSLQAGLSDVSHTGISSAAIRMRYLSTHFAKTLSLLSRYHAGIVDQYIAQPVAHNEIQLFGEWICDLKKSLDAGFYERLEDVYILELRRLDISKEPRSHALLYMKQMHLDEAAQQLFNASDELFPKLMLVINPDIEFYQAKWSWQFRTDDSNKAVDIFLDNMRQPPGEHLYLFSVDDTGLATAHLLTDLHQSLLFIFQEPGSIEGAVQTARSLFDESDDQEAVRQQLLSAIRILIEKNWIIQAADAVQTQ